MLKSQTVAEKTANNFKGPLFAAPCTGTGTIRKHWASQYALFK